MSCNHANYNVVKLNQILSPIKLDQM